MTRKRFSEEAALDLLRQIDLDLASESTVETAIHTAGISEATYYKWRKLYGGMGQSQLRELKAMEKENGSTEADRCGTRTGQADPEGEPGLFKAQGLTIADLRQAVVRVRQKLDTSERRTCKTIGLARSSLRYQATPKDDDELRLALIRLAKQYGRYGYRKIAQLLRVEGWVVKHKKVERLWREKGLRLPYRHKRRKRLYHKHSSVIRLRPKHPNHIWSVDFVHNKLSSGRRYKMLTVLDEYTRQALCVVVATKMGHAEVLDALYPLFLKHGKPEYLR